MNVIQSSVNMEKVICFECGKRFIAHRISNMIGLCCYCYVAAGHPPADWHPDCIQAEKEIKHV